MTTARMTTMMMTISNRTPSTIMIKIAVDDNTDVSPPAAAAVVVEVTVANTKQHITFYSMYLGYCVAFC